MRVWGAFPSYLAGVLIGALLTVQANAAGVTEQELKAAFLIKAIEFVRWPSNGANGKPDDPRRICLLGRSPLTGYLQQLAGLGTQPLIIEDLDAKAPLENCDVLFISESERKKLKDFVEFSHTNPVLTVSDMEDFANRNGMIQLGIDPVSNRMRFLINLDAVNRSGVSISSKLVRLATVVEPGTPGAVDE